MKKVFFLCIALVLSNLAWSQSDKDEKSDENFPSFLPVYDVYSSKECIVKLKDGTVVKGVNKDLDRKKGQITNIEVKDAAGKSTEYPAEKVDEMYLYPAGLDKLMKKGNAITNVRTYKAKNLDAIMDQGYCYFKNQAVSLKNKKAERELLMQLVNPTFCSEIQVYGDNRAKETTSIGYGPMKFAGGIDKSYYVKKGEEIFWLKKDEFDDNYLKLFGDNADYLKKYPKAEAKWRFLNKYVYEYTRIKNGDAN